MLQVIDSRPQRQVWSLFSGAMGLDLGLEAAGLAPTLANEIDAHCINTIRLNRPDLPLLTRDIRSLDGLQLRQAAAFAGDVFLIVGGPPCQSFSSGGKRGGLSDPRGDLSNEFFRIIDEVRPRYFVFENVANIATAALQHRPIEQRPGKQWSLKKYETQFLNGDLFTEALKPEERTGSALKRLLKRVAALEYSVVFGVLDASDFGAAQRRLRFVMIGSREHQALKLPQPTFGPFGKKPHRTVRDAIGMIGGDPGPGSEYTEGVRRIFDLVPEGGNWRSLPESIQREAMGRSWEAGGGKTGFYRRLSWSEPSPTITGKANRKGSALCHPSESRPLSVAECAALQGFPSDWKFTGAMNSQYAQIGNAVPVALGEAVGSVINAAGQEGALASGTSGYDEMFADAVARLRASARNKRSLLSEAA